MSLYLFHPIPNSTLTHPLTQLKLKNQKTKLKKVIFFAALTGSVHRCTKAFAIRTDPPLKRGGSVRQSAV